MFNILNAIKGSGFELSMTTDDATEEFAMPSDNSGEIVSMAFSEKKLAYFDNIVLRFKSHTAQKWTFEILRKRLTDFAQIFLRVILKSRDQYFSPQGFRPRGYKRQSSAPL